MTAGLLPDDEHDRSLLGHVHPPDWANPEPADRYDLVVLGGGTGGLVSAAIGAGVGGRVALVERGLLGGDCLNTGCVPSKALLRSARAWEEARSAEARFGGPAAADDGDFARVMERLRRLRAGIAPHDSAARFRDLGVDVFLGEGRFTGPDRLEVAGEAGAATLRFRRAIVATGGRPAAPPISGLADDGFLTSETVFGLTERPARLVVIGAGAVGCELAQAFARLGSDVTLLEAEPRILPLEDAEAAAIVHRALEADGVTVRAGVRVQSVEEVDGDPRDRAVRWEEAPVGAGSRSEALCTHILVAAGRRPNVTGFGLEAAGVELDEEGGIAVDDRLRTSNRRIFAVGDVTGGARFTHQADAHARIAVPNALFFGRGRASRLAVPRCIYTSPEVAYVGIDGAEAERRNARGRGSGAVETLQLPFADLDRALLEGETEGFLRIHFEGSSDRVLGATIVGAHAGELIAPLLVAMKGGVGLDAVSGAVFPYPTRAEILKRAADQRRRRKLTPRLERWMGRVLSLLR